MDRIFGAGLCLLLGALMWVPSAQAGQKIRFSNPPAEAAPGVVDLKNSQSLAPDNLAGFRRGGEVATDVLPVQTGNEGKNPAAEKKRLQMLEERNNWLGVGADGKKTATSENGEPKTEGNLSDKDNSGESRQNDATKNQNFRLSASELSRMLNNNPGDVRGNIDRDREKKLTDKPETGNLSGRVPGLQNAQGMGPTDIRGGVSSARMAPSFEDRESMRQADADRFRTLLTPTPLGRPGGGGGLGDGGALSGGVNQRGPATLGLPGGISSGGSLGASGPMGPRSLGGGLGSGPAQLGPQGLGQGLTPGMNKTEEPLRQQPKPAVLQIPKRNQ